MKYIFVLFLILLNTSNLKKLRFLSESEFSMNILQYIDYAKNEGNYISKFKELFKKSDKKIQKLIKNIRIYQLDNIGYNELYDFMIEDYDNIIIEILEQAYFTGLYQTNYIKQFIFKSKKILSSNWSKVSLIFQKNRIRKLNFISFFQRYKDSELEKAESNILDKLDTVQRDLVDAQDKYSFLNNIINCLEVRNEYKPIYDASKIAKKR